jgi:predicted nucleic acid-binding protein
LGVIIDTSVWIPAVNDRDSRERAEVDRLLSRDEVVMVGIVMAEILRGVRSEDEFRVRQEELSGPLFAELDDSASIAAARLLYDLARKGEAIPLADALIAAQALVGGHSVYTFDEHFSRVPGLRIHRLA